MNNDDLNKDLDDDLDSIIGKDADELEEEQTDTQSETPAEEAPKEDTPPVEPEQSPEETTPPETPPAEPETPPETLPETPPVEAPKPVTADEIRHIFSEMRNAEQATIKDIQTLTDEIVELYYPQGIPTAVTDENGKEYKTPQDVVDAVAASGGEISIEDASQWLMNEQFKLDQQIKEIKQSATTVAEANANFRNGGIRVMQKYKDIFDRVPGLQQKAYKNYMRTVKVDDDKGIILNAPDIEEHYAEFLEPYVLALQSEQQSQPSSPPAAETPKIPDAKQTVDDRLDETGDGGIGANDKDDEADPNDPDASLNKLFKE